jgi:hypothetical protein
LERDPSQHSRADDANGLPYTKQENEVGNVGRQIAERAGNAIKSAENGRRQRRVAGERKAGTGENAGGTITQELGEKVEKTLKHFAY